MFSAGMSLYRILFRYSRKNNCRNYWIVQGKLHPGWQQVFIGELKKRIQKQVQWAMNYSNWCGNHWNLTWKKFQKYHTPRPVYCLVLLFMHCPTVKENYCWINTGSNNIQAHARLLCGILLLDLIPEISCYSVILISTWTVQNW